MAVLIIQISSNRPVQCNHLISILDTCIHRLDANQARLDANQARLDANQAKSLHVLYSHERMVVTD